MTASDWAVSKPDDRLAALLMRILLAGASGQLGRQITAQKGTHEVQGFSHKELEITSLDDVQKAVRAFKPDLVLNAAFLSDADKEAILGGNLKRLLRL